MGDSRVVVDAVVNVVEGREVVVEEEEERLGCEGGSWMPAQPK